MLPSASMYPSLSLSVQCQCQCQAFLLSRFRLSRVVAKCLLLASNYFVVLLQAICFWQAMRFCFVFLHPSSPCLRTTVVTDAEPQPVSNRLVVRLPRLAILCNAPKS